eukprot:5246556-Amphidinium_carterae.2
MPGKARPKFSAVKLANGSAQDKLKNKASTAASTSGVQSKKVKAGGVMQCLMCRSNSDQDLSLIHI